jgi:hypothetical protein
MQAKSIPEPARSEHERLPFPTTGDNFQTVACIEGASDLLALLEAIALLEDVIASGLKIQTPTRLYTRLQNSF